MSVRRKCGYCLQYHAMGSECPEKETPSSLASPGSEFISREEVQRNHLVFLDALDRAIEFHRTNTNDPHNVGTAVMVALTEVRDAFKAYMV